MVFGKGGGTLAYKNRITAAFDHPGRREPQIRSQLLRTYPALWDVPIAEAWSGPIDYSLSGLPFFVRLREAPSVLVCAGFSGDGVGPSRLAGEILAEMAADGGSAGLPGALRSGADRAASTRADPLPRRSAGARGDRSQGAQRGPRRQAKPRRPASRQPRPDRLRPQGPEAGHLTPSRPLPDPTNSEIAAAFDELGDLYELDGASIHRIVAYRNGAKAVREASGAVAQLAAEGRATKLPGIGATLQEKIVALTETGEIPALEKLRAKFPPGLVEMTKLPGLGPKRARRLYEELGIDSLDSLTEAATAGRISELKGFGDKAEQALLEAVAAYAQAGPAQRIVLHRALAVGEELLAAIRAHPATDRAELAGSARRMTESVKDLDIVATATDPGALAQAAAALPQVEAASTPGANAVRIRTHSWPQRRPADRRARPVRQRAPAPDRFEGTQRRAARLRGAPRPAHLRIRRARRQHRSHAPLRDRGRRSTRCSGWPTSNRSCARTAASSRRR